LNIRNKSCKPMIDQPEVWQEVLGYTASNGTFYRFAVA
jgi:hypothetical protein